MSAHPPGAATPQQPPGTTAPQQQQGRESSDSKGSNQNVRAGSPRQWDSNSSSGAERQRSGSTPIRPTATGLSATGGTTMSAAVRAMSMKDLGERTQTTQQSDAADWELAMNLINGKLDMLLNTLTTSVHRLDHRLDDQQKALARIEQVQHVRSTSAAAVDLSWMQPPPCHEAVPSPYHAARDGSARDSHNSHGSPAPSPLHVASLPLAARRFLRQQSRRGTGSSIRHGAMAQDRHDSLQYAFPPPPMRMRGVSGHVAAHRTQRSPTAQQHETQPFPSGHRQSCQQTGRPQTASTAPGGPRGVAARPASNRGKAGQRERDHRENSLAVGDMPLTRASSTDMRRASPNENAGGAIDLQSQVSHDSEGFSPRHELESLARSKTSPRQQQGQQQTVATTRSPTHRHAAADHPDNPAGVVVVQVPRKQTGNQRFTPPVSPQNNPGETLATSGPLNTAGDVIAHNQRKPLNVAVPRADSTRESHGLGARTRTMGTIGDSERGLAVEPKTPAGVSPKQKLKVTATGIPMPSLPRPAMSPDAASTPPKEEGLIVPGPSPSPPPDGLKGSEVNSIQSRESPRQSLPASPCRRDSLGGLSQFGQMSPTRVPDALRNPELSSVVEAQAAWLPDAKWRVWWDVTYFILQLCETFSFLLTLGMNWWDSAPGVICVVFHLVCTFFFCADMYVRSGTAVLEGWELMDSSPTQVRQLYLRSWFAWDAAAAVPLDLLLAPLGARVFRVANVLRLLRVPRIFSLFQSPNPLVRRLRFANTLFFVYWFALLHHAAAVVWMAMRGRTDDGSRIDAISGGASDAETDVNAYILGVYWAVTTLTSVGYGDITPDNPSERVYSICTQVVGVGIYAVVLGNVSLIVSSNDYRNRKLKEKKDKMVSLMAYYDVPWGVQKEAFGIFPVILEESKTDYIELLGDLPPFLQEKIGWCIKMKLVSRVPMFQQAEHDVMLALAGCLCNEVTAPAEYVIKAGEPGNEMFFLAHGLVEVLRVDEESGGEVHIANLRDGSWFGEIALLKATMRTASVRTITTCDMFILQRSDFLDILLNCPGSRFEAAIREEVDRRIAVTRTLITSSGGEVGGGTAARLTDQQLTEAFNQFDLDRSGFIDQQEFALLLDNLGLHPSAESVASLFASHSGGGGTRLHFAEFCEFVRGGLSATVGVSPRRASKATSIDSEASGTCPPRLTTGGPGGPCSTFMTSAGASVVTDEGRISQDPPSAQITTIITVDQGSQRNRNSGGNETIASSLTANSSAHLLKREEDPPPVTGGLRPAAWGSGGGLKAGFGTAATSWRERKMPGSPRWKGRGLGSEQRGFTSGKLGGRGLGRPPGGHRDSVASSRSMLSFYSGTREVDAPVSGGQHMSTGWAVGGDVGLPGAIRSPLVPPPQPRDPRVGARWDPPPRWEQPEPPPQPSPPGSGRNRPPPLSAVAAQQPNGAPLSAATPLVPGEYSEPASGIPQTHSMQNPRLNEVTRFSNSQMRDS